MEAVRYWILTTPRYRWIMVTPAVVDAEDRLKRVRRLHISLTSQSPSLPLCGQFHPGDYSPWPLLETKAVATEDACVGCVRALAAHDKTALGQANRMLFVQGMLTEIQPAPTLPAPVLAEMESLALVIQQQQQQLQQQAAVTQQVMEHVTTILLHMGVTPPEVFLALTSPAPRLPAAPSSSYAQYFDLLLSYEVYKDWLADHPFDDTYIVAPSPKHSSHLIVHRATCTWVLNQAASTYSMRLGVTDLSDPTMLATALRREPDYCGDCLKKQAPRAKSATPLLPG